MLSKSQSRPKSETVIGGGLCPDTWATAFNDSYVGTFRSCAFGQNQSLHRTMKSPCPLHLYRQLSMISLLFAFPHPWKQGRLVHTMRK